VREEDVGWAAHVPSPGPVVSVETLERSPVESGRNEVDSSIGVVGVVSPSLDDLHGKDVKSSVWLA
jgi:hypothetical protein